MSERNNNILGFFYNVKEEFIAGVKCGFSYYVVIFIINAVLRSHVKLEVLIYIILMVFMYNKMKNHHISLTREITTTKLKTEELIDYVINLQEAVRKIEIKAKQHYENTLETETQDPKETNKCEHKWLKQCFGYDDYWHVCQLCGEEAC